MAVQNKGYFLAHPVYLKPSGLQVWGDTPHSRPGLTSPPSSVSHPRLSPRHILELGTRQPRLPASHLSDSDSLSRTKVSIYNLSLIRPRPTLAPSGNMKSRQLIGRVYLTSIINQ